MMRKTIYFKAFLTALIAATLVSGCGYRPVVVRGPLAEGNGVNVTLFANKSYRPGVEGILARNLIDEFAFRSGGKVLPGDQADLELTGVILSYATVPVSYTALDSIKEYNAVIGVQAVLREQHTQKVVWKGDFIGQQVFPVDPNIALQKNAEETATVKICRRLSEEIWQKIGERF